MALRLARGAGDGLDKEGVLVKLVYTHREAGRLEEAVRAAFEMDEGGTKALMLCRLANSFAEERRFERAAELLSESLSTLRRAEDDRGMTQGLLYDIVVGEQRFDSESFPARSETRKPALASLFEAGRLDAAEGFISQLKELVLDPDREPLHTARLLAGLARLETTDTSKAAGLLSESLAAARRAEDADDRVGGLCLVAHAYAEFGDRKTAEALLDEARQSAEALGEEGKRLLSDVASAYSRAGLSDKALKAAHAANVGEWNAALAFYEAAAADGRPEALKEIVTRALAGVATLEGENVKADELSKLSKTCGKRAPDLLADVLGAARSLEDARSRALALAAVGDGYAEAGRKEAALDAWGQAYEAARAVKIKKSDFEPSSSLRGDADKLRLLRSLSARMIRAGDYARAPEVARDMRAVQSRARALAGKDDTTVSEADFSLATLADELTRAGQKEAALSVLAEAVGPEEKLGEGVQPFARAEALAALGSACARAGDKARAALYFRRALELGEAGEDYGGEGRIRLLIEIGTRYAEAGLAPDARTRKTLRRLARAVEADR